uniref:Secreted protein n=1 Tax=Accipiter nisus TaxID=211598 RepID=A0A8B9MLL6_9AVES
MCFHLQYCSSSPMPWARVVYVFLSLWAPPQASADACDFFSKEVGEVRRMETLSAFQWMEVRMIMGEEIKAAFSHLGLSCTQHYMQITRQWA